MLNKAFAVPGTLIRVAVAEFFEQIEPAPEA